MKLKDRKLILGMFVICLSYYMKSQIEIKEDLGDYDGALVILHIITRLIIFVWGIHLILNSIKKKK